MEIRSFIHKGLRQLYSEGNTQGVPSACVDKLSKMLSYLDEIQDLNELRSLTSWKAHILKGSRKGVWSLRVTANYRLTFKIDASDQIIYDVNLEDYH